VHLQDVKLSELDKDMTIPNIITPSVYIEDIPLFPPSINAVPTGITAFIGYTERHDLAGRSLLNIPTPIRSLLEFEQHFGGDALHQFNIKATQRGQTTDFNVLTKDYYLIQTSPNFLLYRSLRLFFNNGGLECYVVSVGNYQNTINTNALVTGLSALKNDTHCSIVAIPDVAALGSANECALVQQTLLTFCSQQFHKRFAILDVFQGYLASSILLQNNCIDLFRNYIGGTGLSYAAAYYPWIDTSIVSSNNLNLELFHHSLSLKKLLSLDLTQSNPRPSRQALARQRQIQKLIDSISENEPVSFSQDERNE
jgi:uncharacterized protein